MAIAGDALARRVALTRAIAAVVAASGHDGRSDARLFLKLARRPAKKTASRRNKRRKRQKTMGDKQLLG
jgi:hypothetical protein